MVGGIESKISVQFRTQAEQKRPTLVLILFLPSSTISNSIVVFFNCPVRVDFQTVQTCIPKCIMDLSISKIVRMNNLIY